MFQAENIIHGGTQRFGCLTKGKCRGRGWSDMGNGRNVDFILNISEEHSWI